MLRNRACSGWVIHRRSVPAHEFRYRVWMTLVDPNDRAPRWRGRPAVNVHAADYLNADGDVLAGVNAELARNGHPRCDRVFVLSQPRALGFFFNPVCFYFCYAGNELHYLLAEINNTPWNEKHIYVLDARDQRQRDELQFDFAKSFHVSPFMPMNLDYCWRVKLEDDRIEIAMRLSRDGVEEFFAGLYLRADELTRKAVRRGYFRYPLQNMRTLGRIYWQAARLYLKSSPVYPHPRKALEAPST